MFKILNLTTKTTFLFCRPYFKFSSSADPYYILGVEKSSEFKEIKKAFYKLANEFHPDKNDSAVYLLSNSGRTKKVSPRQTSIRTNQNIKRLDEATKFC